MEKNDNDQELYLPKLGESITTATIVKWLKKVGDVIAIDEPLLEVATDKVNSEIPSPAEGVLKAIYATADEEKEVGQLLCVIGKSLSQIIPPVAAPQAPLAERSLFLSPAVKRLIAEFNIPADEVEKISRSGENGRLTKNDVERYLHLRAPLPQTAATCSEKTNYALVERVKMNPTRKAIAENMTKSFYSAPHATLVQEVDMTDISRLIQKEKERFLKEHGIKLSLTAFVAYAIVKAIEHYPLMNSTLEGDTIVIKKNVNLGIAVSVDQAVLVPVIRQANRLTLIDIAKEIQEYAWKAKNHHLEGGSMREGTITLTNFGMSGVLMGVPIIRYPECAIIGLGALTKKVVVIENDLMAIKEMCMVSLTFDHRVLDGMYGCGFLGAIKDNIATTNWKELCTPTSSDKKSG